MQLRYRQQVTTAGVAVVALALTLGACSSSSSSSSPGGARQRLVVIVGRRLRQPQRHAQRERIDAPARLRAGGHRGLQVGPVRHDGQLRRRRLGQGTHGPGLGNRQLRGLGLADPRQGDSRTSRARRCSTIPILIAPITVSYNLSGVSKPAAVGADHRGHLLGQDQDLERPGDQGGQPRRQPAQHPDHHRPPLGLLGHHRRTSPSSSWRPGGAPGRSAAARSSTGPPTAGAATATAGWRRSSSPPPGPSGTWTTPTPRPPSLTFASVKNKDGKYVAPIGGRRPPPPPARPAVKPDLTFSAIWAPGASSYPITAQSWVLVYQKQSSANNAKMLKAYIGYLVGDGQKLLPQLDYAPLPSNIDQQAKAQLSKIGSVRL